MPTCSADAESFISSARFSAAKNSLELLNITFPVEDFFDRQIAA